MKAIRVHAFGGPEVLQLEEVQDPSPGPGQVVVRVHAIGVNPVETYIRSGKYTRLPTLPYTPGTDAGGIVEAVGEGVRGVAPNDRVYTHGTRTGAYAERTLCDQSQVHPLPGSVSFAQGAAVGIPCGAAWRALFARGKAQAGETVLVHGATGGVGTAAVQLARAAGLTVLGTASSEQGRQYVTAQGAQFALSHEAANDPQQLQALTGRPGVDLILEMLANVNLGKDLGVLARYGRAVVVGSRGTVEIDPRMTMTNELSILGMTINNATPEELAEMHAALGTQLAEGTLRPVIGREMPLEQAAQAHRVLMEEEFFGKLILVPSGTVPSGTVPSQE